MRSTMLYMPDNFSVPKELCETLLSQYNTYTEIVNHTTSEVETYSIISGKRRNLWDRSRAYYTLLQQKLALVCVATRNNEGVMNMIRRSELAKLLKCDSKSISAAGKRLDKTGLFYYIEEKIDGHWYVTMRLLEVPSKENCYFYMSKEFLTQFMDLKCMHEGRLALRIQLKQDTNAVFGNNTSLSEQEIVDLLPSYIYKKSLIEEFFRNCSETFKKLFNIQKATSKFLIESATEYIGRKKKLEQSKQYDKEIRSHIDCDALEIEHTALSSVVTIVKRLMYRHTPDAVLYYLKHHELPSRGSRPLGSYLTHLRIHLYSAFSA